MSEPLIHPLPLYPNFLSKADAIANEIKLPGNVVIGALVRLWLYAELNGDRGMALDACGPFVKDADAEELAAVSRLFSADAAALLDAMQQRDWLRLVKRGAEFPKLKRLAGEIMPSAASHPEARELWFADFWVTYKPAKGSKGGKEDARRVWAKIKGMDLELAKAITSAAATHSAAGWPTFHGHNPHARRWLHNRMWEDEVPVTTGTLLETGKDGAKTGDRPGVTRELSALDKARQRAREKRQ